MKLLINIKILGINVDKFSMFDHVRSTVFVACRILLILSCVQILSSCTLKAEIFNELKSIVSNPDPSTGNNEPVPLDVFPKDLNTPIFQDDFNRAGQPVISDPRWTARFGAPSGSIVDGEVPSTIAGGGALLGPTNPGAFPELDKTYLENSVIMDGTMTPQQMLVIPYINTTDYSNVGCFFKYENGDLKVYIGDLMQYMDDALTPVRTISGYPVGLKSYIGCEVDRDAGSAVAYLNSIIVGELGSLVVPTKEASVPILYMIGNGIVLDNVKAFPSFENGRALNNGDLRIYNTPSASYYLQQLATFKLLGYCAHNGATIQVKDSNGAFQSSVATCDGNSFSIVMDLTDSVRFPVGANQIRIEYVHGGTTDEYFYNFENLGLKPIPAPTVTIGSPFPNHGDSATVFSWSVDYTDADNISLQPSDVTLAGNTAGCSVAVTGSGNTNRVVEVTGCTATSGTVAISINAGTATNSGTGVANAEGPSASVSLVEMPKLTIGAPTPTAGSSGTVFRWPVTYTGASSIYLYSSNITLIGDTAGCSVSIETTGASTRNVRVTGCSNGSGSVAISIASGTAVNSSWDYAPEAGPSQSVTLSAPPTVTIGAATPNHGRSATIFEWPVNYSNASNITLSASDITIVGSNAGCVASVVGTGNTNRTVRVSGCDAVSGGSIYISIPAGTSTNADGVPDTGYVGYPYVYFADLPSISISNPSPISGNKNSSFYWLIKYSSYNSITLQASDIILNGASAGCLVSVSYIYNGVGDSRGVTVEGCTAVTGNISISLKAGTATNNFGDFAEAAGPSSPVSIANAVEIFFAQTQDVVSKGTSVNSQQAVLTLSQASPVDIDVEYSVSSHYTTAVRPTNFDLVAAGTVTVPAGQTSWPISYNYSGDTTTGSKILQIGITGVKGSGILSVIGQNQVKRRLILDEVSSIQQIESAGANTCLLTTSGSVTCWGRNYSGELGNGNFSSSASPTSVIGGNVFTMISGGWQHFCGLTDTGSIKCWGSNWGGGFGNGAYGTVSAVPVSVVGGDTYKWVAAGSGHSCGITTTGVTKCWGSNYDGEVGDGSVTMRTSPVTVVGGDTFETLYGGYAISCGITSGGTAKCWGNNSYGSLGDGTTTDRTSPVAVSGGDIYTTLTVGFDHTCGLTSTGGVKCWGSNSDGQLGDGTSTSRLVPTPINDVSTYKQIKAGHRYTCGITTSDILKCWGANGWSNLGLSGVTNAVLTPTQVIDPDTYKFVSPGNYDPYTHACGVTMAGVVKCWGGSMYGQRGYYPEDGETSVVGTGGEDFIQLSVAGSHTCGITSSNVLKCWGSNGGRIGDGTTYDRSMPVTVQGDTYQQVSAGNSGTCAVTVAGAVKCWGYNGNGQLGDGTMTDRLTPVTVADGSVFKQVTLTGGYTCALTTSGKVKCWGYNITTPFDLNGTDTFLSLSTHAASQMCGVTNLNKIKCWDPGTWNPVEVSDSETYISVDSGYYFHCGLTTSNAIRCWAFYDDYQANYNNVLGRVTLGNVFAPAPIDGGDTYTQVSVNYLSSCGLLVSGGVKCWGGTSAPEPPQTLSTPEPYVEIAGSRYAFCGRNASGLVRCTGRYVNGAGTVVGSIWNIITPP